MKGTIKPQPMTAREIQRRNEQRVTSRHLEGGAVQGCNCPHCARYRTAAKSPPPIWGEDKTYDFEERVLVNPPWISTGTNPGKVNPDVQPPTKKPEPKDEWAHRGVVPEHGRRLTVRMYERMLQFMTGEAYGYYDAQCGRDFNMLIMGGKCPWTAMGYRRGYASVECG